MMATVKSDPSPAPTPLNPEMHQWMISMTSQTRTFDIEFDNFFGTRRNDSHLILVHLCEIGDIADLGEGLDPLELVCHVQICPSLPKIGEGGARVLAK